MKKSILTLITVFGLATISFAQMTDSVSKTPKRSPEERVQQSVSMMEKKLSLNADQKAKVYTATLERMKAVESARAAKQDGTKPDKMAMKAVMDKFDQDVSAVLNAEQKVKYEALKDEQKQKLGAAAPKKKKN